MARNGQVSITASIPMTIPYASFVVGFGFITLAAIAEAAQRHFNSTNDAKGGSGR
jgi:TRAP-type C4-dicarboxylate transport system permease small subunit